MSCGCLHVYYYIVCPCRRLRARGWRRLGAAQKAGCPSPRPCGSCHRPKRVLLVCAQKKTRSWEPRAPWRPACCLFSCMHVLLAVLLHSLLCVPFPAAWDAWRAPLPSAGFVFLATRVCQPLRHPTRAWPAPPPPGLPLPSPPTELHSSTAVLYGLRGTGVQRSGRLIRTPPPPFAPAATTRMTMARWASTRWTTAS